MCIISNPSSQHSKLFKTSANVIKIMGYPFQVIDVRAPASKHQTQLGRVRWGSRRGEGKPNPPRETKNSGAKGGRNWRTEVFVHFDDLRLFGVTGDWKTAALDPACMV